MSLIAARLAAGCLLTLTTFALAADPAKDVTPLPRAEPGKWAELKVGVGEILLLDGGDKATDWELIDRGGADLRPIPAAPTTASFVATKPGRYRVLNVSEGKLVRVTVVVGDAPPGPPPGPGPTPPDPPQPTPPDAALVKKLQDAYAGDLGGMKAGDLKQLVALYLEAVTFAASPDITTAGGLLDAIKAASATLIPAGRLSGVRTLLAAELVAALPTDPAAGLDAETRKRAADTFGRLAKALQAVVP